MNHVQQQYIEKTLNPVLEKMVEQVLEELPEELGDYLSAYFHKDGDAGAASADVQGLRTQNAKLQEELKALTQYCADLEKVIIQIAPMNAKGGGGGGAPAEVLDAGGEELAVAPEAEEESEAEDDEPPPEVVQKRPRTSVSAEAFGDWNKKKEFVPVVYAKRPEERTSLQAVLRKSFLFALLSDRTWARSWMR